MNNWIEKTMITLIAAIILGISAWTCSAVANLQQTLPATYATKSEVNRTEDIIQSRLTRMEGRIIAEIKSLKPE